MCQLSKRACLPSVCSLFSRCGISRVQEGKVPDFTKFLVEGGVGEFILSKKNKKFRETNVTYIPRARFSVILDLSGVHVQVHILECLTLVLEGMNTALLLFASSSSMLMNLAASTRAPGNSPLELLQELPLFFGFPPLRVAFASSPLAAVRPVAFALAASHDLFPARYPLTR